MPQKLIHLAFLLVIVLGCDRGSRGVASVAGGTFGPEFTFTNNAVIGAQAAVGRLKRHNGANDQARDELIAMIARSCPECRIRGGDLIQVTYPDGFYFKVTVDRMVVEVTARPMTTDEMTQYIPRLQKDLFDSAATLGLYPHRDVGGGHIHLGIDSHFGGDSELFKRFIIDYYNHPALALAVLRDESDNNPHFIQLRESQVERLRQILEGNGSIEDIAEQIQERVYKRHPAGFQNEPEKYYALNFTKIAPGKERTLEVRAIRPQESALDFEKVSRLFEARIEYLKNNPVEMNYFMNRSSTAQLQFSSFVKYIDETGLNHLDFLDLLPPHFVPVMKDVLDPADFEKVLLKKIAKTSPLQLTELTWEIMSLVEKDPGPHWLAILELLHRQSQGMFHLRQRIGKHFVGSCLEIFVRFGSAL